MRFEMAGKTDIGRQRVRNEDNYLILKEFSLSAVADGMGGHVDGNIASQIAVDTIRESYRANYPTKIVEKKYASLEEKLKEQEQFLTESIQEANHNIFSRNKGNFTLEGMGTTVVALQISEKYALTACVGDSRIYLFRDEQLRQLTQDHSLVGELVRYNIIGEQDLIFLQNKNIITRALGMSDHVVVDTVCHKICANDLFLLCSDGLTDLVNDKNIQEILRTHCNFELTAILDALINEANNCGGQDNITVALVKIQELP